MSCGKSTQVHDILNFKSRTVFEWFHTALAWFTMITRFEKWGEVGGEESSKGLLGLPCSLGEGQVPVPLQLSTSLGSHAPGLQGDH